MTKRIVVIGAGMGGLASSMALAGKSDAELMVLEAASGSGGKIGYAEHEGVRFDTGPSILTLPGIARALFSSAGRDFDAELELVESTPNFRYYFADGTELDVFNRAEATAESIERVLGTQARQEFDGFMVYARRIWEAASPNFIMGPAPSFGSVARLGFGALKQLREIDSMRTMLQAIEARISDRRLRSLFLRYATYNGSDPRKAPATLSCIAWVELGMGCWGVAGGMRTLAATMERIAREAGAQFRFDTPVLGITQSARNGFRIRLADDEIEADAVIVNADAAHLVNDLLGATYDCGVEIASAASMSAWNAVIKARRRSAERRPGHALVFPEREYIEEFVDIFDHHRAPLQPTIYLCAQEKAHKSAGWPDHEALFVMANAAHVRGLDDERFDWQGFEQQVLQRLRALDLIEADDEVVWRRNPAGLAARFPGSRGSLYGAASNSAFDAFRRPPNRAPAMAGLYLAGGSAHPGGGVPLCIQSGRQAAAALLEDGWRKR
ncbi:MAG: phytoene desaturase [Bradymonadaceae bacterium]|nr:phytoene desaturase [Lujinxingiaceae bacterium]